MRAIWLNNVLVGSAQQANVTIRTPVTQEPLFLLMAQDPRTGHFLDLVASEQEHLPAMIPFFLLFWTFKNHNSCGQVYLINHSSLTEASPDTGPEACIKSSLEWD